MIDTATFETECGKFFRSKFGKIKGYEENPRMNGKFPDFKIEPEGRAIFFEIYRPKTSKIKKIDKKYNIHRTPNAISAGFDLIKSVISLYVKEKRKKEQLPEYKPSILILDFSLLLPEAKFIYDFFDHIHKHSNDSNACEVFKILPSLSSIIFYDLINDGGNKVIYHLVNHTLPATINGLAKEEKKIIEESLK